MTNNIPVRTDIAVFTHTRKMRYALKQVIPFSGLGDGRLKEELDNICFNAGTQVVDVLGTDGHCMGLASVPSEGADRKFLISIKDAKDLRKTLKGRDCNIAVRLGQNCSHWQLEDELLFMAQRQMYVYPRYEQLITAHMKHKMRSGVIVHKNTLRNWVSRVCTPGTDPLRKRFKIDRNTLFLDKYQMSVVNEKNAEVNMYMNFRHLDKYCRLAKGKFLTLCFGKDLEGLVSWEYKKKGILFMHLIMGMG